MNNPNPFVPQGSLLEQKNKTRSRVKLAVFCVVAINVLGLTALLMQGCKREQTEAENTRAASGHQSAAGGGHQSAARGGNKSTRPPPPMATAHTAGCPGRRRD